VWFGFVARIGPEMWELAWTISRLKSSADQDLRQRPSPDSKRGFGDASKKSEEWGAGISGDRTPALAAITSGSDGDAAASMVLNYLGWRLVDH
jgi:hypothetical protein